MQDFIFENPFLLTSLLLLFFLVRDLIHGKQNSKRIKRLENDLKWHEDKFIAAENSLRLINCTLVEMNAPFPKPETVNSEEYPFFLGFEPETAQYEAQMKNLNDNMKIVSGLLQEYMRQNPKSPKQ